MRGVWSEPDVAGTSAVVDLGAASDCAVECLAWDGGGHREIVDGRTIYELTIYELTIYELLMVVVYMLCVDVLLFLRFEHIRAGGGVV